MSAAVIVLTANWQYWQKEKNIQKILKWKYKNKIQIVESHPTAVIRTVTKVIPRPLVVRLLNLFLTAIPVKKQDFSPDGVFDRDDNICQYWHYDKNSKAFKYRCTTDDRTIDHIIPTSRGGKSSFENCVCACKTCNITLKKNKTPEEAGLRLIRKPFVPVKNHIVRKFLYDMNNFADKVYYEKCLGRIFSHIV